MPLAAEKLPWGTERFVIISYDGVTSVSFFRRRFSQKKINYSRSPSVLSVSSVVNFLGLIPQNLKQRFLQSLGAKRLLHKGVRLFALR